jgi:hypothetical protein
MKYTVLIEESEEGSRRLRSGASGMSLGGGQPTQCFGVAQVAGGWGARTADAFW